MAVHYPDQHIDVLAQDADMLTMGITPTGTGVLHQGHYVTMMNFLKGLSSTKAAKARIFIDDREFNNQDKPRLAKLDVISTMENTIEDFLLRVSDYLHDNSILERCKLLRMSDFFAKASILGGVNTGHDLLRIINGNRDLFDQAFAEMPFLLKAPVKPICGSCETGPRKIADLSIGEDIVEGMCDEPDCSNYSEDYSVDVKRGDTAWAIYYTLVGLRDVIMAAGADQSVLHVYGGDYGASWGHYQTPKAERIHAFTREALIRQLSNLGANGQLPVINHYVGPLLKRRGSRAKLSKSSGDSSNGLDVSQFDIWSGSSDRVIVI